MDTEFWYSNGDDVCVEYSATTHTMGGPYGDTHADVKETEITIHSVEVLGVNITPSAALINELKSRIGESL